MNSDQIKAGITHAAGIALAWAAGRYHLSPDQVGAMMSDVGYIGSAAAFGSGVYQHFGMKKVPTDSVAVQVTGVQAGTAPIGSSPNTPPAGAVVTGKVVG